MGERRVVVRLLYPLPALEPRPASERLPDTSGTPLGRGVAARREGHGRLSGVHLLNDGRDAFAARVLLARRATRSLDLQYYIWRGDVSGTLLLEAVRDAADRGVRVWFAEICYGDLPLYSYDYDADYPEVANAFKAAIRSSDAILIVTPEYNRSIPGPLKNAIDWASRPYGTNAFAREPTAVIGASPGSIGTARACAASWASSTRRR